LAASLQARDAIIALATVVLLVSVLGIKRCYSQDARAIESTVRNVHNHDICCIVVSDCCWARTPEWHENSLEYRLSGQVMTAAEIKAQFA